jgi:hypothetical protein
MILSTKREVFHDPREIEPRQRKYSRLNRKHPCGHSRKYSTSTEAKMPKIQKQKKKSSSKMSFWGSPDSS